MSTVAMKNLETQLLTIVCDDRCFVVRQLAAVVKCWDRARHFVFIQRDSASNAERNLVAELDASRWSLMLVDENKVRWFGPEAIPIILKNLPFGKIAAVAYILPGTMWLTRQLYMLVSRTRNGFVYKHSI
ncbi:MAG TPA: DCC1-like thiol-disulfide oxidoreductase family protein [Planktothrix sp.]|jgi:predicted DCC family thiol-disulfide oxidoreductase YuxK